MITARGVKRGQPAIYTVRITGTQEEDEAAGATAGAVEYRLLGPLEARRDGAPIDLGAPKQRLVLAMLLLNRGRVVSTDALVDAVWPVDPPSSTAVSLQAYISNLRRALRDPGGDASPITRRTWGYALETAPEQLDLTAFSTAARAAREAAADADWETVLTAAEEALALWGGPLLQELADEPSVRAEAGKLEELHAEVRESLTTALLAEGRIPEAIIAAQGLVTDLPLRDRGCWLLMIGLYRAGRAPEALERFREHSERLDEELGLEPGVELRELQVQVLQQEPALAAWPRTPGWGGAADVSAPVLEALPDVIATTEAAPEQDAVLVGREREVAVLDRALAESNAGAPSWVVLTGPAGIGKTRLAQEAAARGAAAGGAVAWARCPEEEGSPAWWPIRQLVRALGADSGTVLVPPAGSDADEARFTVYDRVAEVINQAAAAGPPIVVVIDDVQWADTTSARCLAYLAGALQAVPVTFVLTLRDGDDEAQVRPLLTALARADGLRQLAVSPLAPGAVRDLAGRVGGNPLGEREADELHARTGGNPLFVREYARLGPDERVDAAIPLAVRAVLGRRLDDVDPSVLVVLRAAAVAGDVIDLDLVAALTRLDADEVADLLDDAADDHIVVPTLGARGYSFSHGLLREELLAQIPTLRRQRLHARLAQLLCERGAEPSLRARHLLQALPVIEPADALEACRAAARADLDRWSFDTAADWWGEALHAWELLPAGERSAGERDDLITARVEALALAGRRQTVLETIEVGMFDAVREGRTSTVGRLAASLLRVNGSWSWPASADDPARIQTRLADLLPFVSGDPVAESRLLAAMAIGNIYDPDPAVPDGQSLRAIALAEATGDPDVLADALLGRVITYSGIATHAEECLMLLDRLAALPHGYSQVDDAAGHAVALMAGYSLGRIDVVEDRLRRGITAADVLRLPVLRVQLRWAQGQLAQWHGDLDGAAAHFCQATERYREMEGYTAHPEAIYARVLAWEGGKLAAIDDPGPVEPAAWSAAIAATRGDRETAVAGLDAWLATRRPLVWSTLCHATLAGHVAADVGAKAQAAELIDWLTPFEQAIAIAGHGGGTGPVALALARLHLLLGHDDDARTALTTATRIATDGDGKLALARCDKVVAELGDR